jgi:hypothetical protein
MDVENNEIFTVVEEEVQKMGFFQRLISLFTSPVRLMQNIKNYPVIAPMLFLVMALSLLTMPFINRITEITSDIMSEIMLMRYGQDFLTFMDSAQSAANTQSASAITIITTVLAIIIAYPILCFAKALVLLIITKFARGGAKYAQYASLYAHVLIITVVGALISTPIMAAMGTLLDISSLAAVFMPAGNFSQMSYNLLSSITLFSVLEAVLLVFGVKVINDFSNKKAIIVVSIMFTLSVLFTTIIAGSSLFFMDMSYKALGYI